MPAHKTKRPYVVLAAEQRGIEAEIFDGRHSPTLESFALPVRWIGRTAAHELPILVGQVEAAASIMHRVGSFVLEFSRATPSVTSEASVQAIAA